MGTKKPLSGASEANYSFDLISPGLLAQRFLADEIPPLARFAFRFRQRDVFVLKLRQANIDNRSLEKQLILKNDHVAKLVDTFECVLCARSWMLLRATPKTRLCRS